MKKKTERAAFELGRADRVIRRKYAFAIEKRRRAGGASTYPDSGARPGRPACQRHQGATLASSRVSPLLIADVPDAAPAGSVPDGRRRSDGRRRPPRARGCSPRCAAPGACGPRPLGGREGLLRCAPGELAAGDRGRRRGYGQLNFELICPGGRGDQGELFHSFN